MFRVVRVMVVLALALSGAATAFTQSQSVNGTIYDQRQMQLGLKVSF